MELRSQESGSRLGSPLYEPENSKSSVSSGFLFSGTRGLQNLGLEIRAGSPFPGIRELVMTCSKIEDRLYPDTSMSKNTQNRFFRRVPSSLGNGTVWSGNLDAPNSNSSVCVSYSSVGVTYVDIAELFLGFSSFTCKIT